MSTTTADDRLRRALEIFRALLELPTEARDEHLRRCCEGDDELQAQVARLCAADRSEAALDRGAAALLPERGPDPRLGRTIGPFRLDAVLGEGGMGTVFRATRVAGGFEQQVALKLIRGGVDGIAARQRFERERAILARLDHPDLAPLLDGGVADDGSPWYAMPLIDGSPVTQWCDTQRLPLRERVALIARLCDAVQAAHRALVVHRDLKPSNILVDARGAPHLLDFGIAKLLEDGDDATQTAARLMTPAYAAPEQIRGEPVSTATDVFALGVILFELACGRRPFVGDDESAFSLQRAVVEAPPRRLAGALSEKSGEALRRAQQRQTLPARLRRELRGDLTRIVDKALAKDPMQRYESAAALGDDLRRWLAGDPVRATPASLLYRARKFLGRWRWALAGAALVTLALIAATTVSLQQARVAREAQRAAEAHAESARAAQQFMENAFIAAEPWRHDGTPTTAIDLADRAFETADTELAGQAVARADLYWSLIRMYLTAGNTARAIEAGERAIAIYDSLPASPERRAEAHLRTSYGYSYLGYIADAQRHIDAAAAVPDLGPLQRFMVSSAQALIHRDRGRYDLSALELARSLEFARRMPNLAELPFALGDNARMRRHYTDAAHNFLLQDRQRDDNRSRGWRALMAIYRLELLAPLQRRPDDVAFADRLEAERAAVWPDGSRRPLFTAMRASVYRQHGLRDEAAALARALPLTAGIAREPSDSVEVEYWLALSYVLLGAGDLAVAAKQFDLIETMLLPVSDAADPRLLLARVGAACARGETLPPSLVQSLDAPPQPEYLGYAWLRDTPCAQLRDSAAAHTPAPQPYAEGPELRAALDTAARRMGECQNGMRVAVGAPCQVASVARTP
jgi:tetratricopeptide (TPR) repeat protein